MNYLLDTCTFLWLISEPKKLSSEVRSLLQKTDVPCFLSVVSVWEIVVKYTLGKLPLKEDPQKLIPFQRKRHCVSSLELTEDAALHLGKLPSFHQDPFDRMLIVQALSRDCTLITPDPLIRQYPIKTLW